jgi:hypothetical protein
MTIDDDGSRFRPHRVLWISVETDIPPRVDVRDILEAPGQNVTDGLHVDTFERRSCVEGRKFAEWSFIARCPLLHRPELR